MRGSAKTGHAAETASRAPATAAATATQARVDPLNVNASSGSAVASAMAWANAVESRAVKTAAPSSPLGSMDAVTGWEELPSQCVKTWLRLEYSMKSK